MRITSVTFKPFAIKDAAESSVSSKSVSNPICGTGGVSLCISIVSISKLCVLTFGLFAIDTSALIALLPKPISVFGRVINAFSTDAKLFPSPAI